jgi:L-threo-3-deoxy-hexylosonate aldolase
VAVIYQRPDAIIDIPTLKKHAVFLANAGIKPLLAGSMGEGVHLSHSERVSLIKATREALDDVGFVSMPIIIGTGAGSTRETIQLSKEAAEAGADYVIVITPGYFAGVLAGNKKALKAFFTEVAEKSPVPVIIYNCEFISAVAGPTGLLINHAQTPGLAQELISTLT